MTVLHLSTCLKSFLILSALAVGWGTTIGSAQSYANPPTWHPMTMLNVNFDTTALKLDVVDQAEKMGANVYPVLTVARDGSYDPAMPWGMLNGTAWSRRLGWDDPNRKAGDPARFILTLITNIYGSDAGIWIDCVSRSPGLEAYLAIGKFGVNAINNATNADGSVIIDPTLNAYSGIFGTAGSSTRWRWDGQMDHNTYAVALSDITVPDQLFMATYKVYVGDPQGNEILNPDGTSASTTEVWTWQGPATGFQPELKILHKIAVEWPGDFSNYVLEWAESADSTVWTRVDHTPVVIAGTSLVLVDASASHRYFRLRLGD